MGCSFCVGRLQVRFLFAFIVAVSFPSSALAAIAFVSSADSSDLDNANSASWTHNVTAGDDRILVVMCGQSEAGTHNIAGNVSFDATQTFTSLRSDESLDGAEDPQTDFLYLVNPNVTNGTISVSFAGFVDAGKCESLYFTGVDQTTPMDDSDGAGSGGTGGASRTVTLNTTTENAYAVGIGSTKRNTIPLSATTGQTLTLNHGFTSASLTEVSVAVGYEALGAAGAESFGIGGFDPENDDSTVSAGALRASVAIAVSDTDSAFFMFD